MSKTKTTTNSFINPIKLFKIMSKKLLTFLTLLTLFFGVGWAETYSYYLGKAKPATWVTASSSATVTTSDGFSFSLVLNGSGSITNALQTSQIRLYQNSTFTITPPTGELITNVTFYHAESGNSGTLKVGNEILTQNSIIGNNGGQIWTCSGESELIITASAQCRVNQIDITTTSGGSTPTNYALTLPTGLTGGTVTATGYSDLTAIPSGTSMTVTATPSSDSYELDWMKANGTEVSNPYTFNITENTTITAAFREKSVTPGGNYLFYESFDNYNSKGGRDNDFANGSGSFTNNSNDLNWSAFDKVYGANKCIRMGTSSNGSMTSPIVGQNVDETTLAFDLAGWSSGTNTLTVTINNSGTFSDGTTSKTFTATNSEWNTFTETVINLTSNTTFTFSGKRFFLDEIKLETPAPGDFAITIDGAIQNGTVVASKQSANSGDEVTLTVTPEAGYEVTALSYNGTAITPLTSGSDPSTYTFTMPNADVTITATFALAKNEIAYTIAPANSGEVWLQNGTTYDQSLGYSYSTMGTTVSIALAAYPGYDVNSLAITDATGATVPFTKYNSEWNNGKWVTYYTFVMPATAVNIAATFKSGDIYILGTANDNPWDGNKGVKMTYDAGTNTYSADVYFASETATGKGQFSFASNLSGTDGNWNNIGKRWGAQSQDYDLVTNADGGIWTENNSDPNRFTVPYGVYEIKVNWGTGLVTATKKDITVTLDKAAGQLENGTTVNVVSNLTSLLSACKSGVSATLAYSTNDGANYTDGSSFAVNSAMTAKGKAYYGTIEAESDAYAYTVVTHYAVTATANPTAGGTVSVSPASALAGETVTITANPKNGYQLTSITVNGDEIDITSTPYTFTMPAQATEVIANFSKIQYAITKAETHCTVNITGGENVTITTDGATAGSGDVVTFTVTPITDKYSIKSVSLVWDNGAATTTTTPTLTDGVYSFYMQARPVVITAVCEREAVGDGSFVLVTDASTLKAGDKVIITNSKTAGSLTSVAMSTTQNTNNRGETEVTIVDGPKITPSASVQVFTLEGDANGWYFNTGSGYIYAASSSSNYLRTETTKDDNAKAAISITNDVASIVFQGTNTRNVLQYNTSGIFSCYSSASQSDVYLFKQTAAGLMVEIDPEGGEVIGSQDVVIDANIEDALVQYKIGDDGEWSTPATGPVTATITGNVGDNVKVYAKATLEDDGETLTDETDATFTFVAPNAPVITPASCSITSETQSVTITSDYANGTIEYSTDGGTTWNAYTGQFNVVVEGFGESKTVQARVTYNGVTSEIASATYTRGVQPVVFSPANGTYYGDQTCQMFSTSKNARIYYTTDGSEPSKTNGTLYTGEVSMPATGTYQFKAVAYIGNTASTVSSANYNIRPRSEGTGYNENYLLFNVAELNAMKNSFSSGTYQTNGSYTMVNPVQVVWMSTYKNVTNGYPEYCLIRDNTGYGMIYFGKNNSSHAGYKIFDMGDWISGGYNGKVSLAYSQDHGQLDTHPELGASGSTGKKIYQWPESALSNASVLPEYITIPEILASETPGNIDYWGHYVHLRKNTVQLIPSDDPGTYTTGQDKDGKWSGTITDENGNQINYYDKFYLQIDSTWTTTSNFFTGHPNRTFDIYGFVACHLPAEIDYQIAPFAFAWIDQPICDHETGTYTSEQTVKITSPNDPEATIWYKTSEMDDYHVYTGPITVNSTTTIEWYATKQSQYNDELESKKGTITMTFATINPPAIAPESQVKAVGSESVNSTITRDETDGLTATIWFTIDGSDPSDPSSERYVYNAENQAALLSDIRTTTTVRAIAEVDGIYSAEAEARTYTFVKSNGIVYDLVTSVSQLNENGVYVIVSQNYSEALSTTQNTTNRGAAGVLFVEDTNKAKVYGNDDVAQFTLTVLTHDEDTSPERHFLMQTNNSSQNGYLYVGSESNNTLLTEANEDAMGNDVAVITIDADGRAHIHFNYAGGDNRYLQYWNRDRLFNTYKTEYADRAVYIYGVNATPLATIEKEGTALPTTTTAENQYTIADQLIAVHYKDAQNDAGEHYLWCKDQGNVSISKTEKTGDDQIDYLKDVTKVQNGDWDQSNWVLLKFETSDATSISNAVGHYIKPANITGHYTDSVNFTITMPAGQGLPTDAVGDAVKYTPNVYCPVNFLDKNLNIGGGQGPVGVETGEHYFFMNPKIQEVATVTYAVWNGTCFVIPAKAGGNNQGDFDGAFSVDWTYNVFGDVKTTLQANTAYHFLAVLNTVDANTNGNTSKGAKAGENAAGTVEGKDVDPQPGKMVYALDLQGGSESPNIITAIKDVVDVTGKTVAGVKYYNLAGIESDRPFEGVNIIVTTYTDGSRSSSKVLK